MLKKNYLPKDLGARLKALLIERDISQRELSTMLNLDEGYISNVISGKRSLILSNLDRVCKLLDTTPNYLMYGEK